MPSQGTLGPSGLSHLLHDLSLEQALHSCQDPILPVPDPGSDQHCSCARVLSHSLSPCPSSAGTQLPALGWCQALQPKSALFSWKGGTSQGLVDEINLWKRLFYRGSTSARAQHVQVGASATFPWRGVSRQEFQQKSPSAGVVSHEQETFGKSRRLLSSLKEQEVVMAVTFHVQAVQHPKVSQPRCVGVSMGHPVFNLAVPCLLFPVIPVTAMDHQL